MLRLSFIRLIIRASTCSDLILVTHKEDHLVMVNPRWYEVSPSHLWSTVSLNLYHVCMHESYDPMI